MDLFQGKKELNCQPTSLHRRLLFWGAVLFVVACLLAPSLVPGGARATGFPQLGDFYVVADYRAQGEEPMQLAYDPAGDCIHVHLTSDLGHRLAAISARTGRQTASWLLDRQPSPGVLGAVALDGGADAVWVGWEATLARVDLVTETVSLLKKPYAEGATIGVEGLAVDSGRVFVKWHDEPTLVAYAYARNVILEALRVQLPPAVSGTMVSGLACVDGRMLISTYAGTSVIFDRFAGQTTALPAGYMAAVEVAAGRYYVHTRDGTVAFASTKDSEEKNIFDLGEPIQVCARSGNALWVVGETKVARLEPSGTCLGVWNLPSHITQDVGGPCVTVSTCGSCAVDGAGRLWLSLSSFGLVGFVGP